MLNNTASLVCILTLLFCQLDALSLEEKVGQLLIVHFQGETANAEAQALIQETKVGGIIYYEWANGLHSPGQVKALSDDLQHLAKQNPHPIPLFIAIDQEGGVVTRLKKGFTLPPNNREVGETDTPFLAQQLALIIGNELRAVGVNLNFAPVVDIDSNPDNPIIGSRSFGNGAEKVIAFAKNALEGYREAGILATLKHFPGHGDVEIDSHLGLPTVSKSLEELELLELLPFRELAPFADMMMTAHLLIPAFDTEHCATLSKKTIDYLREQIGFQGIVVTDSLVMQGVLENCGTVEEAAIQALQAGCDLLLLGGDRFIEETSQVHRSLVAAVRNGRLSEERIDEALGRVLRVKEKYLLK